MSKSTQISRTQAARILGMTKSGVRRMEGTELTARKVRGVVLLDAAEVAAAAQARNAVPRRPGRVSETTELRNSLNSANARIATQVTHAAMLRATLSNALDEIRNLNATRDTLLRRVIDLETAMLEH